MNRLRRLGFVAWALSITVGALWIRLSRPQDTSPLLAALVYSEPFHVFAHLLLYGTLAWLVSRRFPLRAVVPIVLAFGTMQELAQALGVRAPGGPELFDLGVDLGAAVGVVIVTRALHAPPTQASYSANNASASAVPSSSSP